MKKGGPIAKPSPAERRARLEAAIRAHGWSMRLGRDLARELGVSKTTIYRDRQRMLAELGNEPEAEEAEAPADRRSTFLQKLRGHQSTAATRDNLGPLAAMLRLEAQILGVDGPAPGPEPEVDVGAVPEGRLAQLVEQWTHTRRLRLKAEAESSFVAAAKLLAQEQDLLDEIRAEEAREREASKGATSTEDKVAALAGLVRSWPAGVRQQFAELLAG